VVTRRLGRDGPEISVLGFGTWALAGRYRFGWGAVDDDESVAAIRRAVEAGVGWVDTAPTYGDGHSEEVVVPPRAFSLMGPFGSTKRV
jgi:aryl-alcohol dehydrogenase-like predicted oxidoreductase